MKKIYRLTLLLIFIMGSKAGFSQDAAFLEANNIKALVPAGTIFYDSENSLGGFEAPVGSGNHTMFTSAIWVAGLNENGDLHTSAGRYLFDLDLQPGPVMNDEEYTNEFAAWDRVWKITREEVETHISEYASSGYQMPEAIENWPAQGDIELGQAENLAPYEDTNSNGFYDPENGDYPLIHGDEAVYFIFNDDLDELSSGGISLKIEFHSMAYAFNCSSDSALDNTIFVNYRIINRSGNDYFETFMGNFTDFDMGNATDDYVGSDVSRGTFYGFNGDNIDEESTVGLGYGEDLPAQAVVFLAGPDQDEDGIDNPFVDDVQDALENDGIVYEGQGLGYGDGIIDNERLGLTNFLNYWISTLGPLEEDDFYYAMQTIAPYDYPWDYPPADVFAKMTFPGNSDPLFYSTNGVEVDPWTEATVENTPGDRRGIGSSGPFTFEAGSEEELDLAFVFARSYDSPGDNWAPVEIMKERIDDIRSYYLANETPCGTPVTTGLKNNQSINFSLFPNPAKDQINIQFATDFDKTSFIIYNAMGTTVQRGMLSGSFNSIDVSSLASGIYVISIFENGNTSNKRFIVGH